jgi:hypothetical protein
LPKSRRGERAPSGGNLRRVPIDTCKVLLEQEA